MTTASNIDALRSVVEVRWRLLESYALARQEGLVEPVGLIVDPSHAFARELGRHVLVGGFSDEAKVSVGCMERLALSSAIASGAPEVALTLRGLRDEPGQWAAVLVVDRGLVLTGTWQELMTASAAPAAKKGRSRAR